MKNGLSEQSAKNWELLISYSWGDEEEPVEFASFDEAWSVAIGDAAKEVAVTIQAHPEDGVTTSYSTSGEASAKTGRIELYYGYDGEYCYYTVRRKEA